MNLLSELAAALRFWTRRPLVAMASIVSLAVGLAVASSVFAVADAALWRPLPIPGAERVVWINSVDRGVAGNTAPGVFSAWVSGAVSFEAMGAMRASESIFRDDRPGQRVAGAYATAGAMKVLAVQPVLGRAITEQDDRPGAPLVLVISDRFWRSQYASSPSILGRSVILDGKARTIVGVMNASIDNVPFGYDWWAPLAMSAEQAANIGPRYLNVIGRLRSADSRAAAAELSTLSRNAGAVGDTGAALGARLESLKAHFSSDARPILLPLLGAVLAVVLLGSLNAASLLLAQGQSRRAEIALRASLGAGRARLVRQLLFESMWLTGGAAALSLLVSLWIVDSLKTLLPYDQGTLSSVALDWRTALFTFVLAAAITSLCGLLPAVRNSSIDLRDALVGGGRAIAGSPDRLRRGLVMLQVGLAITVGAAGALMARTTVELMAAPRGYDAAQVLTAAAQFPSREYPSSQQLRDAIARVATAAESIPGVRDVALATRVPLSGGAPGSDLALVSDAFKPGTDRQVRIRFVTPRYFSTVGTPLVHGRDVAASDVETGGLVVLVNETLARRLADPSTLVERTVKFAVADFNSRGPATPWTVVGVVADARDEGPRAVVQPEVYVPMAQGPGEVFDWIGRRVLIAARAKDGSRVAPADLRTAIAGVEPGLAIYDLLTLDDRLRRHLATERTIAAVLVPVGLAGFGLAAFGLFTLLMQIVADRRRELAIRIALGATPGGVIRSLVNEALQLTATGAVVGCGGAVLVGQLLSPLVFGVSSSDPLTILTLVLLTVATTTVAVWLPARRAAAVDPASVLRAD